MATTPSSSASGISIASSGAPGSTVSAPTGTHGGASGLSRATLVHACLARDDGFIDRLVACIRADSTAGDEEVHAFIKKFGGLFGLATLMKGWIGEQIAIYENFTVVQSAPTPSSQDSGGKGSLSPVVEATTPTPPPPGLVSSAANNSDNKNSWGNIQSPQHSYNIYTAPSRDEELDGAFRQAGPVLQVKQKTAKKRLTPSSVADTISEIKGGRDISAAQSGTSMASSSTDSIKESVPSKGARVEDIHINIPRLSISVLSPMKSKYDEMGISVSVESHNSYSYLYNDPLDHLSAKDSSRVDGLARILSALMLHLYVPLKDSVVLTSRMLAIQYVEGSRLKVESTSSSSFCVSLTSDDHLRYFVSKVVEHTLPLIVNLGPLFITEVLELEHVLCLSSDITTGLRSVLDDASGRIAFGDTSNFGSSLGRDGFVRVFQSDLDDRNQYKSPDESAVFNERERLYDEISELYRKYQDTVAGDLDGSKMEEYWKVLYRAASKMVSGIRDCNIAWLTELLLEMLLHYGTNAATAQTDKFPPRQSSASNNSSGSSSTIAKEGDQKESKSSAPSTAPPPGLKIVSSNSQNLLSSNPGIGEKTNAWGARDALSGAGAKRHLLEARMGPGGIGVSNSFAPPARVSSTSAMSSSQVSVTSTSHRVTQPVVVKQSKPNHYGGAQSFGSAMDNPVLFKQFLVGLERPASSFPGNEQFFYRFILFCDSYRFIESFQVSIICAIESISASIVPTASIDNFTMSVIKLKLLGRFLGLLIYWPRWILSMSVDSLISGPLRTMVERMALNRNAANAFLTAMPLVDVMKKALRERRFCLTLPWVAEFLKIMLWDYATIHAGTKDSGGGMVPNSPRVSLTRQSSWTPSRPGGEASCKSSQSSVPSDLAAVHFLMSLFLSERKTLSKETLSTNRLFVLFLLEDFIRCAPQSLRTVDRRVLADFDVMTGDQYSVAEENIDDDNLAFSKKSFIEQLTPIVFNSVLILQKRRMNKLRSRSPSTSNPPASGSLLKREASGSNNFPDMTSPMNVSRSLFATSPISIFSPGIAYIDAADNVARELFRDEDKLPGAPGLIRRLSSPGSKLESIEESSTRPESQGDIDGAMAVAFKSPYKLLKPPSFSASVSLTSSQHGGTLLRSPTFENRSKATDNAKLVSKLEGAFWRQQPHLQTLSRFVLEQLNQGIRAHTKDIAVTEAVRSAWAASDRVKKTLKQELSNTAPTDLLAKLKTMLQGEIRAIRAETIRIASEHANKVSRDFISDALPNLMRLHPTDDRVISLGIDLMKGQVNHLLQQLNEHIVSYATRKLEEVYKSSLASFNRIIEASVGKTASDVVPQPPLNISVATPSDITSKMDLRGEGALMELSKTLPYFVSRKQEKLAYSLQMLSALFEFPENFQFTGEVLHSETIDFVVAAIDPFAFEDPSNLKNSVFFAIDALNGFLLALVEFLGAKYRFIGSSVSDLMMSLDNLSASGDRRFVILHTNLDGIINSIIDWIYFIFSKSVAVRDFTTVELMGFFAINTASLMYLDAFLVADGASRRGRSEQQMWLPTDMLVRCVTLSLVHITGAGRSVLCAVKPASIAYYRDWIGLVELPQVHISLALCALSQVSLKCSGRYSNEAGISIAHPFGSIDALQADTARWAIISDVFGAELGAALRKALCEDAIPSAGTAVDTETSA